MTILRKIIDGQNFKISQEDGVYFSKVAHYFRKLFQKLVFLKEHFPKFYGVA